MAVSRDFVLKRMEPGIAWDKRLVIEPFFKESLLREGNSASIDIHLGNRFTMLRTRGSAQHDPLANDPRKDVATTEHFIRMGQEFSVRPGHIVLGTTLEWFRFPTDLLAYIVGRSIWGRRGLYQLQQQQSIQQRLAP